MPPLYEVSLGDQTENGYDPDAYPDLQQVGQGGVLDPDAVESQMEEDRLDRMDAVLDELLARQAEDPNLGNLTLADCDSDDDDGGNDDAS